MKSITALGDLTVDVLLKGMTELPDWGQEVRVAGMERRLGGNLGNMVRAAWMLSMDNFAIRSLVGDDEAGREILAWLKELGFDGEGVDILPGKGTSVTHAPVRTDGERSFLTYPGVVDDLDKLLTDDPKSDMIFLTGWSLPPNVSGSVLCEAMDRWQAAGKMVAADVIWESVGKKADLAWMDKVDLLFMNEDELMALTGPSVDVVKCAKKLHKRLRPGATLAVKRGAEGCLLLTGEDIYACASLPIEPRDAVGAGDTFNTAYIKAWSEGHPATACLAYASAFTAMHLDAGTPWPPCRQKAWEAAATLPMQRIT